MWTEEVRNFDIWIVRFSKSLSFLFSLLGLQLVKSDHRMVQCLKICLTLGLLHVVFVSFRFRATLRAVSKTWNQMSLNSKHFFVCVHWHFLNPIVRIKIGRKKSGKLHNKYLVLLHHKSKTYIPLWLECLFLQRIRRIPWVWGFWLASQLLSLSRSQTLWVTSNHILYLCNSTRCCYITYLFANNEAILLQIMTICIVIRNRC